MFNSFIIMHLYAKKMDFISGTRERERGTRGGRVVVGDRQHIDLAGASSALQAHVHNGC